MKHILDLFFTTDQEDGFAEKGFEFECHLNNNSSRISFSQQSDNLRNDEFEWDEYGNLLDEYK